MGVNRFGYEWSRYRRIIPEYEGQFAAWTVPISKEEWKGKAVLDAGCGTGRNSLWPLKYGASRVMAFDVDPRTVAVARTNLAEHEHCEVTEASIYDLPWKDEFDVTFSIGVIHHLEDPRKAVANLVAATKPGGTVLIWVYGWEGHTGMKRAINAIRKVTCKFPLGLLSALVWPFSLVWWVYTRIGPHNHPYLAQFRSSPLWHLHSILFDQLLPPIANYWRKEEAMALFDGLEIEDLQAEWINKGSWTVWGKKAAQS